MGKRLRTPIPTSRSNFIKVKCSVCGYENVIFSHASYPAKCVLCGTQIVKPTGGKARIINAEVLSVLE
ncbi:MAG: 30S ribosomal protein S27e [Sulfolobales archaeon]|nr:30S ribosomal protein S27e [Sulfolobales archaeon]MCX8198615.1 30S ribosomal protein S27e [Sulfolobales archaeon]MDW8169689.1 30S ribosomal protein S27e [Desulfurococcaceae archaeon]